VSDTSLILTWRICDRARVARDRRFDGRFFTGVRTTRVYCRPVCPVKPAKSCNVIFFVTAAAAERAGHAGASPRAVAATRRVQRAKTLLDETAMPIAAVAFAAGFSSIRRFNAAFRAVYRRPSSAIRRSRPPAIRRRAVAS